MPTLYIIGNGFDIAHNLHTSYWNFRKYLAKYAEDFLVELEKMYGFSRHSSKDALNNFLWKNFEYQLSQANDDDVFDLSSSIVSQLDLESGPVGIVDTMDDYWENQYKFILKLNSYLKKWVRQIRLTKAIPKKLVLVNNYIDYFLVT